MSRSIESILGETRVTTQLAAHLQTQHHIHTAPCDSPSIRNAWITLHTGGWARLNQQTLKAIAISISVVAVASLVGLIYYLLVKRDLSTGGIFIIMLLITSIIAGILQKTAKHSKKRPTEPPIA